MRIACVGDSITFGMGTARPERDSYPAQLQRMLGVETHLVGNFGRSGATLLEQGDKPYVQQDVFAQALAFAPDVVVIQLGTNDTKPHNWVRKAEFAADYTALILRFQSLASRPRIFVSLPPFIPGEGNFGITEPVLLEQLPLITTVARETGATVIDIHAAFLGQESLLPDRVHPNKAGATLLARTVFAALVGKPFEGEVPAPAPAK